MRPEVNQLTGMTSGRDCNGLPSRMSCLRDMEAQRGDNSVIALFSTNTSFSDSIASSESGNVVSVLLLITSFYNINMDNTVGGMKTQFMFLRYSQYTCGHSGNTGSRRVTLSRIMVVKLGDGFFRRGGM
jgi:hypothetical protein